MHLFDVPRRFYGGHAIVGGGLPVAVGLALADKSLGRNALTACYFGDGAVAEGEFHESMNLASLWRLPVLFLCENNRYAMGTAIQRALAQTEIYRFAEAYRIPGEAVNGMDVLAVREGIARAVARARESKTPSLVEARTYRYRGHSMRDPSAALYRTKEEVDQEKLRDPIAGFQAQLVREGLLDDAGWKALVEDVERRVAEAVAFADDSPEPPAEWLHADVYA
jgi:TPP-dependent pyruvate/acetoin dehydrogenase alpha subunit